MAWYMKPKDNREEVLIAQVIAYAKARGYNVWRQQNTGRLGYDKIVSKVTKLWLRLGGSKLAETVLNDVIGDTVNTCWEPVANGMLGVPDIIGYKVSGGGFIGIEVKIGTDQMRPEQITFMTTLKASGGDYIIARNYEEFMATFNKKL
jgi:hypothetical protein